MFKTIKRILGKSKNTESDKLIKSPKSVSGEDVRNRDKKEENNATKDAIDTKDTIDTIDAKVNIVQINKNTKKLNILETKTNSIKENAKYNETKEDKTGLAESIDEKDKKIGSKINTLKKLIEHSFGRLNKNLNNKWIK
jgi:hypothetical protein